MKRFVCAILLIGLICCMGCEKDTGSAPLSSEASSLEQSSLAKPSSKEGVEPSSQPQSTVEEKIDSLPLPQEKTEFSFLSGAGGWSTLMTLNRDGTFTGYYHDSEMGEFGEEYPNGTIYVCGFDGKFGEFEKLNDYSYKMKLVDIKAKNPEGEEWIEDGIRYVASGPYGLEKSVDFILYLPDTPVNELSEDFLSWWPYRYDQETQQRKTLSCYGILNVVTSDGFFNE